VSRKIDLSRARDILEGAFPRAEALFADRAPPDVPRRVKDAIDHVFGSNTQSYREVLLGCILACLVDPQVDVRKPYANLGKNAYSGRSLDEKVVNPFLRANRVPCCSGPYLAVFRRSVAFEPRAGLKDQAGYDALLRVLAFMEDFPQHMAELMLYVLYKFVELREASYIPIVRIHRLSLEQWEALVQRLLDYHSGGRFPMLLVHATFLTITEFFRYDWSLDVQGINVSDRAAGASGDITIRAGDDLFLAAEITERTVDAERVETTFQTKIAPENIEDYLFFAPATTEARESAARYFAQGHEVNFVEIKIWITQVLATLGARGRRLFMTKMVELLEENDVPATLKMAWNRLAEAVISGRPQS